MPKPRHTQAYFSRTIEKNLHPVLVAQNKEQMEYYMGAKLIEVGVNPNSAVYRWSLKTTKREATWIYTAYWGESKDKLLNGDEPLTGTDLINCARVNAQLGLDLAAQVCGYGKDLNGFNQALQEAGEKMGLAIDSVESLISNHPHVIGAKPIETTA